MSEQYNMKALNQVLADHWLTEFIGPNAWITFAEM
jgi:hypothetical protein